MHDPIIAEVHEARRKLFEEAGCDLHVFFQRLREAEKQHKERLRAPPRRSPNDTEPGISHTLGGQPSVFGASRRQNPED